MGFPIRRFPDQSLFAAPRDLSQRTTSFIASQRQGIHRTPLRHLIALIAKARVSRAPEVRTRKAGKSECEHSDFRFQTSDFRSPRQFEKTSFASNASGDPSGQALGSTTGCLPDDREQRTEDRLCPPVSVFRRPLTECASSSQCQISEDRRRTAEDGYPRRPRAGLPFTPRRAVKRVRAKLICIGSFETSRAALTPRPSSAVRPLSSEWWSQTGSNRRPHACKARALPTELWPQRAEGPRKSECGTRNFRLPTSGFRLLSSGFAPPSGRWWAWEDLNLRPHAYQARALTN